MNIYVQSRGFEQDYDYRWLEITDGSQQRDEPPMYQRISNLIDSKAFSVVLMRLPSNQLLLLITGIKASERRDIWNRRIRISIAWVGEYSDEAVFRMLAAKALDENEQNVLAKQIDDAVIFGSNQGFQVSFQNIARLVQIDQIQDLIQNDPPDKRRKVAKNSPEMKNALAEELKKTCLPTQEELLVVVTGIREIGVLKAAEVWRGLSSIAGTDGWEEISNSLFTKLVILFKTIILRTISILGYREL